MTSNVSPLDSNDLLDARPSQERRAMELSPELNASLNALILEVGADIAADVRAKATKAITNAVADEREACARLADNYKDYRASQKDWYGELSAKNIASAIRARNPEGV